MKKGCKKLYEKFRNTWPISPVSPGDGHGIEEMPDFNHKSMHSTKISTVEEMFRGLAEKKRESKPLEVAPNMKFKEKMRVSEVLEKTKNTLEIDFNELTLEKRLGKGQFGAVYLATWTTEIVAVKQFTSVGDTPASREKKMKELFSEVVSMSDMPRHPNVMSLLGYCSKPICVVMEVMRGGSVEEFVYLSKNKEFEVTTWEKSQILLKTSSGLKFLHKYGIIHRDIAARNILLNKMKEGRIGPSTEIKVSDFGMSRALDEDEKESGGGKTKSRVGPLKWMAPESIKDHVYSKKSDVYMWGITMWEIYFGMEPYPKERSLKAAMKVLSKEYRPDVTSDSSINPKFVELMQECWETRPGRRPDFKEIHKRLKRNKLRTNRYTGYKYGR